MLVIGSNSASTGYNLTRSLRTRASASGHYSATFGAGTSVQKGTQSFWFKRGTLATTMNVGMCAEVFFYPSGGAFNVIQFTSSDTLQVQCYNGSTNDINLVTTQVFRDPSAWYHVVVAWDTTQATAANRAIVYVNGTQVTAFTTATYPAQNTNLTGWGAANVYTIGADKNNSNTLVRFFDGYLTEFNYIDGQQLTPSSFGSFNALTGVWQPARFTGTYGINGFFLQFTDPTSAISLGYDAIPATRLTSGSGTYTIPAYTSSLVVECWGGGGGGAGTTNGSVAATAGTGGTTTFGTLTANGGIGGTGAQDNVVNGSGGAGGTASGGDVNTTGNTGVTNYYTGLVSGANAPYGGLGGLVNTASSTVGPGGGGGSGGAPSTAAGGAGGSGGYVKKTYAAGAISGSISYSIGAGGTAGSGSSFSGNAGAAGAIRITVDGVRVDRDWYPRGISVAAGVTYDSMTDVPTLTSATAANYCVMNPLFKSTRLNGLSNGNLRITGIAGGNFYGGYTGTMFAPSGKIYWEVTAIQLYTTNSYFAGGIATNNYKSTESAGAIDACPGGTTAGAGTGMSFAPYISGAQLNLNGSTSALSATYAVGDVMNFALDASNGNFWIGKNNTWLTGNPSTNTSPTGTITGGTSYAPWFGCYTDSDIWAINLGQQPFAYTPPTGFVALNTYNLPTSTIVKGNTVMDATLWTGDSTSPKSQVNAGGFQPDLVWIKNRSNAYFHNLFDSVRGAGAARSLQSNTTNSEATNATNTALYGYLSAFNSNGFSTTNGTDPTVPSIWVNQSSQNFVGWQWQAGQGSTSSNTNGTITSTVSVNASAGFSVVTYTGTGANATVGHGLGVAPQFIIIKNRNGTFSWRVYFASIGNGNVLFLNGTDASTAEATAWNSTTPTSSVFSVGTSNGTNGSTLTYVAYCWTPIAGFSAFGSYTGNGSADGPMIYTGFRPKFVLFKRTDSTANWEILDSARNTYNLTNLGLYPDLSFAEQVETNNVLDLLSNGFKVRGTGSASNVNGASYIYACWAETPFKNSLAR